MLAGGGASVTVAPIGGFKSSSVMRTSVMFVTIGAGGGSVKETFDSVTFGAPKACSGSIN